MDCSDKTPLNYYFDFKWLFFSSHTLIYQPAIKMLKVCRRALATAQTTKIKMIQPISPSFKWVETLFNLWHLYKPLNSQGSRAPGHPLPLLPAQRQRGSGRKYMIGNESLGYVSLLTVTGTSPKTDFFTPLLCLKRLTLTTKHSSQDSRQGMEVAARIGRFDSLEISSDCPVRYEQ